MTTLHALGLFRIFFSLLLLLEVSVLWNNIDTFFNPDFHFSTFPIVFLPTLSELGMRLLLSFLALSLVIMGFGLWYRAASLSVFLGYGVFFFYDKTVSLNNHFYLFLLIAFLFSVYRTDGAFALKPTAETTKTPQALFAFKLQVALVYFWGGIRKINSDWLSGEPVRTWLLESAERAPDYATFFQNEVAVWLFAYGGLFFDLLIGFFLFSQKLRFVGIFGVILFSICNAWVFDIGVFPWFTIASLVLYVPKTSSAEALKGVRNTLLLCYFLLQFLLPLRPWVFSGYSLWTWEGARFSWNMKLRRMATELTIYALHPKTRDLEEINPCLYLSALQARYMSSHPEMLREFSDYLADELAKEWGERPAIYLDAKASLNGRGMYPLIDPEVDLSEERYSPIFKAQWITKVPDKGVSVSSGQKMFSCKE